MKTLAIALLTAVPGVLFAQQKGYTINGKIAGKAEGMKVYLHKDGWENKEKPDSAVIRKGQFIFKGHLDAPRQFRLIIDRTPKGKEKSERNWVMADFYAENSVIGFAAHIDSMGSYFYNPKKKNAKPTITGSASQSESENFVAALAPLVNELGKLNEEYLAVYHLPAIDGKFNTKEGVELSRKKNALGEKIKAQKWEYIKANPSSIIAFDNAMSFVQGMYVTLTGPQLAELEGMVRKGWNGTTNMKKLESAITNAKRTAIGEKYLDFEFSKPDGSKVKLSDVMPKDKYVLLEFWASWCGPCRGEIPHLREVNKHKADNFDIISISIDERDADWKKAMKEEAMVWTQLCDPHGFAGEVARAYNISGIPFSLLLDKNGKIIAVNVRGAQLDLALESL